jgi:hypothetical protein
VTAEPESYPCSVCGDPVPQCQIEECEDCFNGDHDNGICSCCYGVICPKHTATVTCPHSAPDHDGVDAA